MQAGFKYLLLLMAVVLVSSGCIGLNVPGMYPLQERVIESGGPGKILLIDISGVIDDKEHFNLFGMQTKARLTARIREELDMATKDRRVKALILRINSPGGEVTTTDIIFHEIKEFKKRKDIPIIAELMGVAASGGYYIAAAADEIIAHPTTITGAIGVVAYRINASGLLEKIGIVDETVKSGAMKDMGSPLRPTTREERALLQGLIDNLFERFKFVVTKSRGLEEAQAEGLDTGKIFDGRVFTSKEALELNLIDSIGYLDDAIKMAEIKAGITGAAVISYSRPGSYRNNIYSGTGMNVRAEFNVLNIDGSVLTERSGLKFLYLWMP